MAGTSESSIRLADALQELDRSPRLQRAQSAKEEASWGRVESYSGFLPSISANGSHLLGKKFAFLDVTFPGAPVPVSIPQIIPSSSYSINAQWTLFDGLANVDRYQAARSLEHASRNDLEWTRFQSEREVILLFFLALTARTLKEVAVQNLKNLDDHLNDAKLLRRSGESTNYEVLRVEVKESEAKAELLNAEDEIAISRLRLGDLLGRSLGTAEVEGELPLLSPADLRSMDSSGVGSAGADDSGVSGGAGRADLAALQNRVYAYEQLSDSAGKHWVPRLGLFGQFIEYNNRNDSWLDSNAFRSAYSYGFNLTWDLFDGLSGVAKSKQAIERRFQEEKTLEMAQIRARSESEAWRRRFLYSCSISNSRASDVKKATESVRLARAGRKAGMRTSTDLLDAELELFRARAGQVNAQMGAIEGLINLELSIGRKLYEFK